MGSELLDSQKEDSTMFILFVFFLLHTSVTSAEECPDEKKVGDTCYTRVAFIDTTQYGCMENCTYKKTNSSDTGHYCFKPGSLQVTECVYTGTDTTGTDITGEVTQSVGSCVDCIKDHCTACIADCVPDPENPACIACVVADCIFECGSDCT